MMGQSIIENLVPLAYKGMGMGQHMGSYDKNSYYWSGMSNNISNLVLNLLLILMVVGLIVIGGYLLANKYRANIPQNLKKNSVCPSCKTGISDEFKFCPKCTTSLQKECEFCKKKIHLIWNCCPYCGGKTSG